MSSRKFNLTSGSMGFRAWVMTPCRLSLGFVRRHSYNLQSVFQFCYLSGTAGKKHWIQDRPRSQV